MTGYVRCAPHSHTEGVYQEFTELQSNWFARRHLRSLTSALRHWPDPRRQRSWARGLPWALAELKQQTQSEMNRYNYCAVCSPDIKGNWPDWSGRRWYWPDWSGKRWYCFIISQWFMMCLAVRAVWNTEGLARRSSSNVSSWAWLLGKWF